MDFRDLKYFAVIAEEGHVGRAAERLYKTQPALTKCIDRLEEQLGAPLFERVGRGIRLTPVGEALLPRAAHQPDDGRDRARDRRLCARA
jgi:DNA-binding transcriptional LysR family regulator